MLEKETLHNFGPNFTQLIGISVSRTIYIQASHGFRQEQAKGNNRGNACCGENAWEVMVAEIDSKIQRINLAVVFTRTSRVREFII